MSFSADWLALRRESDARARDTGLATRLAEWLARRPGRPLRILDLGSGTGANMAALAPLLPGPQHWTLVDNDPNLLERATAVEGLTVDRRVADLSGDPAPLFEPAPDLVTASAFFDLAGAGIAEGIAARTAATGAAFLTVLTYDGREDWQPPHTADAKALAAFHADQRRDKGLGAALGPDATDHLAAAFRGHGYTVTIAPSDWVLEAPGDAALIAALADGSATAVRAALGPAADDWHAARRVADRVMIGHQDLLALPPGR